MVTPAEAVVHGAKAELSLGGKRLRAEILSPPGAVFEVVSTRPPAPQNQNAGTRKLVVKLADKVTRADIDVRFSI
jgi:hypothetical protein